MEFRVFEGFGVWDLRVCDPFFTRPALQDVGDGGSPGSRLHGSRMRQPHLRLFLHLMHFEKISKSGWRPGFKFVLSELVQAHWN